MPEYVTPALGNSSAYRTALPAALAVAFVSGVVTGFVTQALKSLVH